MSGRKGLGIVVNKLGRSFGQHPAMQAFNQLERKMNDTHLNWDISQRQSLCKNWKNPGWMDRMRRKARTRKFLREEEINKTLRNLLYENATGGK